MRSFFNVFKFEFIGLLKTKAFIVSTIIICLIASIGLSIPTIKDMFEGNKSFDEGENIQVEDNFEVNYNSNFVYGYINENSAVPNVEDLKSSFYLGQLKEFESKEELEESIISEEIKAGFIIESPTEYKYVVKNNEMVDSNSSFFKEALARAYRIYELDKLGISYTDIEPIIYPNIQEDTVILGKDSAKNYFYTYILIFILYFIIIFYGQMIATSIASEKSNRAMELLITSTDSRNLIFGKVFGVALAGITQVCVILTVAMTFYKLNSGSWNNKLDFIFNIPTEVLLTFSVFGILGYIFYAFIFGALGALVSRTEDVASSSSPITIIFIAVFLASNFSMYNTEGILLKVLSYIPFSSFMAMFIRVSMGTVHIVEVLISLGILVLSTILLGVFASKIYRMGTLMYGNPIKLTKAIKLIRKNQ